MKIFNTEIYGLKESAIASGYPKLSKIEEFRKNIKEEDINRLKKLGGAKQGSGHDCALKGIIVQADIQAPQHFWLQWQRYHFADIISSQSKMHKLTKINIKEHCSKYILPEIISLINKLQQEYNQDPSYIKFRYLLDNTPMGFLLTARITTNYLQLKTMYSQRQHHKNEEWKVVFKEWVEELPLFKEICGF